MFILLIIHGLLLLPLSPLHEIYLQIKISWMYSSSTCKLFSHLLCSEFEIIIFFLVEIEIVLQCLQHFVAMLVVFLQVFHIVLQDVETILKYVAYKRYSIKTLHYHKPPLLISPPLVFCLNYTQLFPGNF